MPKKDLVTQDNALINASYTLELVEKRLILLAIARSRKSGKGITANDHLGIYASDYADSFNVESSASYKALKSAAETLFNRYFVYDVEDKKGNVGTAKSRWVSEINYFNDEGYLRLIFAPSVVPFITDLEKKFTSYFLDDVSALTSAYAIRLYELIIAWRSTGKTPVFELAELRAKLGVAENEYQRMFNFKQRVLDVAVNQINEHTNIRIKVEQHKRGRAISGFSFSFKEMSTEHERDPNTIDWIDEAIGNIKKKQKQKITVQQAEKMARAGESWDDLKSRLSPDYIIMFKNG
jgi:plasmid replication initiation protein